MKNILKAAKIVLIPLGLTAATINAAIQNTFVGSATCPLDLKKGTIRSIPAFLIFSK